MIVDTEKVLREADGSVKLIAVRPHTDGKVFAPGCTSKPEGESREEPEEHKRNEKTAYIQARSFMARTLEINGKACQAEGEAKVV